MPRKAPKEVVEHRLTLGDYERKVLTKQLAEDDILNKAATGAQIGKTVAITGAVVGGTIAAGTIGMLAVSAYREANQLVEGAQDLGAGLWSTMKWRAGLISFDDYLKDVTDITTETEEEKAEKERRENMGFLEWGLDSVLTFLLGKDKKWTKTVNVTEEDRLRDEWISEEEYEKIKYSEENLISHFGSMANYQNLLGQKHEFLSAINIFCDPSKPTYDIEVCQETKEDFDAWKARIMAEYGMLP